MDEVDFIGAGWSYPLGADPTGRVALVTREREIEQSIRLILGTSIGERPMRSAAASIGSICLGLTWPIPASMHRC